MVRDSSHQRVVLIRRRRQESHPPLMSQAQPDQNGNCGLQEFIFERFEVSKSGSDCIG